jgi:hypothetical protein
MWIQIEKRDVLKRLELWKEGVIVVEVVFFVYMGGRIE